MAPMAVYGSRVFLFLSKNKWKETWLSLTDEHSLSWKRKDAYQVKGTAEVDNIFEQIGVALPSEKHLQDSIKPFFLSIPLKIKGKTSVKKLALLHGEDLDLWLQALANIDGHLRLYTAVRQKRISKLAETKDVPELLLLSKLEYKELVTFYKDVWDEFLRHRRNPPPPEQVETIVAVSSGVHLFEINGHNGHSTPSFQTQESIDELDESDDDDDGTLRF